MPLKVATLNVRGLHAPATRLGEMTKRVALLRWVKVNKVDVLLLQETHATDKTSTDFWTQQWGGQALWAPSNTPHSGGTAILINRQVNGKLTNKSKAPDGSWARADLEVEDGTFTLISAYAPSDPARRGEWLQNTFKPVLKHLEHPTIAGGDWNCVSNSLLDSTHPYAGLLQGGTTVDLLMAEQGLDDVLRCTQPDYRWYTRWEKLMGTGSTAFMPRGHCASKPCTSPQTCARGRTTTWWPACSRPKMRGGSVRGRLQQSQRTPTRK